MSSLVWNRYGHWSAHLYVDNVQACRTPHGGNRVAKGTANTAPMPLAPSDLSPQGTPYGRACTWCVRIFHAKRALSAEALSLLIASDVRAGRLCAWLDVR